MKTAPDQLKEITDTITSLKRWKEARENINKKPEREGKPLDNRALDNAIKHLTRYEEIVSASMDTIG